MTPADDRQEAEHHGLLLGQPRLGRGRLLRRRDPPWRPDPADRRLAAEGLQLLNFNVEAQCTPSRSALLTGRHPLRSGTADGAHHRRSGRADPVGDHHAPRRSPTPATPRACGANGTWAATRSSAARSTSASTRRCGARGPPTRSSGRCSPTSPRARSTPTPYAGEAKIPMEPSPSTRGRRARRPRSSPPTTPSSAPASTARSPTGRSTSWPGRRRTASRSTRTCPTPRSTSRPIPDPEFAGQDQAGQLRRPARPRWTPSPARSSTRSTSSGIAEDTIVVWASDNGAGPHLPDPVDRPRPGWRAMERLLRARGAAATSPRWRAPTGRRASCAGRARCPRARSATSSCTSSTCSPRSRRPAAARSRPTARSTAWTWPTSCSATREESGRDTVLCIQGNRLQAVKWHQWKIHMFQQDEFLSTWTRLQHAAPLQPRVGPARGAPGRLPARLGHAPDGRRRQRLPDVAGRGAADQGGHPGSRTPRRSRASGSPRPTSSSGRSPSSSRRSSSPTTRCRICPIRASSTRRGERPVTRTSERRGGRGPRRVTRPKNLTFMVGWLVFLGDLPDLPGLEVRHVLRGHQRGPAPLLRRRNARAALRGHRCDRTRRGVGRLATAAVGVSSRLGPSGTHLRSDARRAHPLDRRQVGADRLVAVGLRVRRVQRVVADAAGHEASLRQTDSKGD